MLTYMLEKRGAMPLYESLYRCIKADIMEGKLRAGDKLPSKRKLAEHLNISVITVENAYSQLLLEGYIYSKEKSGYFVSSVENKKVVAADAKYTREHGQDVQKALRLDLRINAVNQESFPFSIWSKLMRQVLSEQDAELLRPSSYNGADKLRASIANHLYSFRGISVDPEQIIIGSGTEYLYNLIIQLLGRRNTFGVENPGYKKIARIYRANEVKFDHIDMDAYGLSVSKLRESRVNVVHISPSHHFPTGIVMPIGRRQELLKWAGESPGRYIIEDDYDSEFRFSGKPVQTLQSIDQEERVIYVNTFTKSLAPSIRISYMVLPEHLVKRYKQELSFYTCTVPSFEQYTLARFIAQGYFEKHINRMRSFYKKQRESVIKIIEQSPINKSIEILEDNAGLHFLIKLKTHRKDEEIIKVAAEKGIGISCLSEYLYERDASYDNIFIVNYASIDLKVLADLLAELHI